MNDLGKIAPKELFEYLNEIVESTKKFSINVINFFIVNDIFELAIKAIEDGCNFFCIENVINDVGIVKDFEIEHFLLFIKKLHDNNPDYYPWFINSLFSKMVNVYPDKVLELIKDLEKLEYKFIPDVISVSIYENKNLSLDMKYNLALKYINSNIEIQYIAGYSIFEKCVKDDCFLKKTEAIDLIHHLIKTKTDKELNHVLYTTCNLSLIENKLREDIYFIREQNNPYTNHVISNFLFRNSKYINNSDYLKKILFSFTSISCDFKGIIQNIDFILMNLIKSDFNLFYDFINKWILESDYKQKCISICNIWNSCFSHLDFNNQLTFIYTSYLLKDEIIYNSVAADIIRDKGIVSKTNFLLDENIIRNCNDEDIIFLCRKILGYIFDINILCSLFDSILQVKINNNVIAETISKLYSSLAEDYGYVVIEYFESKDLKEESTLNLIYNSILINLKNILEKNKIENNYLELNGTYEELLEIKRYQLEEQKKIATMSEEKSVITKLFKKIPLKYGIGFSCNYDGKNSDISFFEEFSVKINISKQDIYSPVNSQLTRTQYKLCKRGDK